MIKKLLPVVFLIVGLGAGAGAGLVLGPAGSDKTSSEKDPAHVEKEPAAEKADHKARKPASHSASKDNGDHDSSDYEYLKLTKQFVVPIVEQDRISGLVTLSLSLEANPGISEAFYAVEPKLRDGFLQILFDHANMGGFDGAFTQSRNLETLRSALLTVVQSEFGDDVTKVLITSIARQDT
ncbi:flagellar basal body-associated FliL family protein [Ruegeria sp. HKCCD8929]|uniref:flagellar basal body-associated FliL family protein n=1 Tax=Ruegeria sp. HKCCD8929 TaxID=2683006 RepID=UPI00148882C4|nr:flagellar basal body-associated FliL family protein [Ruegeria sp. HKCCD8929]